MSEYRMNSEVRSGIEIEVTSLLTRIALHSTAIFTDFGPDDEEAYNHVEQLPNGCIISVQVYPPNTVTMDSIAEGSTEAPPPAYQHGEQSTPSWVERTDEGVIAFGILVPFGTDAVGFLQEDGVTWLWVWSAFEAYLEGL